MKRRLFRPRFAGGLVTEIALSLSLSVALPSFAVALPSSISGSAYWSGVNSISDTLHEQSLSQQYALDWRKNITPYVLLHGAVSYYNFGVSQNVGSNNWRKEFSPTAELAWKHPYFSLGATVQRRQSSSNDLSTSLVADFLTASFRTRLAKYPYLNAQFQQGNVYSKPDRRERDTRDRSIIARTGYSMRSSNISYGFTRRSTEDRLNLREQIDYQHSLRLDRAQSLHGNAVRINASYSLDYRTQSDITPRSNDLPREIPVFAGLYANDGTPDLGVLDTLPSLIDTNLTQPTDPPIDIGSGNTNWNLGVDFGFTRAVSKMYVYTDRPSGSGVRWQVYKSADNIVWQQITATSLFNIGFSRYEVGFSTDTARFIKIVNSGINEVAKVLVTEIEALIDISNQSKIERHQAIHQATLNNSFRLSSKVTASADLYLKRQTGSSLASLRNETIGAVGARYKISELLQSGIRYELGFINFKKQTEDIDKTSTASYDLQYKPLPTLAFFFSLLSQRTYIKTMKAQEISTASVRAIGDVYARLHASTDLGWSRNNLFRENQRYDSWSYRLTLNGGIFRALDGGVSYVYQRTNDVKNNTTRTKNQISTNLTYRLTNNILLQGNVDFVDDYGTHRLTQGYTVSWNTSPKLSFSASAYFAEVQSSQHTDRYSAQVQYSLSARAALLVSYSTNDLESAGGANSSMLTAGLRIAF